MVYFPHNVVKLKKSYFIRLHLTFFLSDYLPVLVCSFHLPSYGPKTAVISAFNGIIIFQSTPELLKGRQRLLNEMSTVCTNIAVLSLLD